MTLGQQCRAVRLSRGWSQQYVATRAGVDQKTVSNVEYGRHKPMPESVQKIARVLGVKEMQSA